MYTLVCMHMARGVRSAAKSRTRLRNLYNFTKIALGLCLDYSKVTPGLRLVCKGRLLKITDLYNITGYEDRLLKIISESRNRLLKIM